MKSRKIKFIALGLGLIAMAAGTTLRAEEEAVNEAREQKIEIEALKEAVESLTTKTSYLEKFHMEGFTDLRYDDSRIQATGTTTTTGVSGMYARRAEIKIFGRLGSVTTYSLGFDLAELKMKDVGVEFADIPLVPFIDIAPEWMFQLKVGQYRQPFGIVPQTSSSGIYLAERPMIFGGQSLKNPLNLSGKLVGERVMGIFVNHKKKLVENVLSWTVQGAIANNTSEDQASGKNKIGSADAFPKQFSDQNFGYQARVATGLDFLSMILPEKSTNTIGASYSRDSANTVWMATNPLQQSQIETYGFDWQTELANKMIILQAEYVHQNTASTNALGGQLLSVQGYYADLLFDFLPLFSTPAKGDALQLILRMEQYQKPNTTPTVLTNPNYNSMNTLDGMGIGLKWSYLGGKNHTAINYFVQANDGQFLGYNNKNTPAGMTAFNKGDMPSSLLVIQQQIAF